MFKRLISGALIFGATALAPPAFAQAPAQCGLRDHIINNLQQKYGETNQASGLQGSTRMVEVWASENDGSWTILFTRPNGITCIGASGSGWQKLENLPKKTGIPS